MKKILAVTAIRSEYFLAKSLFRAIHSHPGLSLELVVSGAHLSPLHGETVHAVETDGFLIVARIESLLHSNRPAARIKGAALQLQVLAHVVDERRPDWLLAVGDREDPMLLALCGAYLHIPVAHYGAGDRVMYNVDDTVRHAISRLSHLMLTTNEDARQRLIRTGEQSWRVHNVGHSGLDRVRETPEMDRAALSAAVGMDLSKGPFVVVIQHPLSSEVSEAGAQMKETLEAVCLLGLPALVIYPNSDAGSQDMIRVIEGYTGRSNIRVFPTLPDTTFVNTLRHAALLIGNSSLGLLEAPYLQLPVINVGRRQTMRMCAENVAFVSHHREEIVRQAQLVLYDDVTRNRMHSCSNPFGDGHAGERVADLLAETPCDDRLLNKELEY